MCSKLSHSLYYRGIHSCLYYLQNWITGSWITKRGRDGRSEQLKEQLETYAHRACSTVNQKTLWHLGCVLTGLLTVQQTTRLLFGNLKWDPIYESFKKFWQRWIKDGFWWPANTYISFIPRFQNLWDHSPTIKREKTDQQQWLCVSVHSSNLKVYPQRFNLLVF